MHCNLSLFSSNTKRLLLFAIFPLLVVAFIRSIIAPSRLSLLAHQFSSFRPRSSGVGHSMSAYRKELHVAELAVQRAVILTQKVFHEKAKGTLSKDDKSPVTIGDFGAQALIIHAIRKNFPTDDIVGEEEASSLRENKDLSGQIWELVRSSKLDDEASEQVLGGSIKDESQMLQSIDEGKGAGGAHGRVWALDPIDGTKGFLRGGQYAVCLALIVDGHVKVGVLGCPNLPVDDSAPLSADIGNGEGRGVLFSAALGSGAHSRPLSQGALGQSQAIHMKAVPNITDATFCESVEAAHSSHGDQAEIAKQLGIHHDSVRMDSQAMYASIARGAGDLYLRLPVRADYQEKIWDHAAGDLIVREAGGQVTDAEGRRLDFSKGRTLKENKGVVAAPKAVHEQVLAAVKSVLAAK